MLLIPTSHFPLQVVLNMTGNRLHNLTRAVAGFKGLSTNTTHYQDITSLILTDTALDTFSHTCLPPRYRPPLQPFSGSTLFITQHR